MPVQQIGNDGLVDSRRIANGRFGGIRNSGTTPEALPAVRDFEEHVSVTLIH